MLPETYEWIAYNYIEDVDLIDFLSFQVISTDI